MIFKSLFRKKPLPPFLQQYYDSFDGSHEGSVRLEDMRFVVFDTETTGLDVNNSKLLSFGGIAINNMKLDVDDSLELIFGYEDIRVNETANIHGILKSHTNEEGLEPKTWHSSKFWST